MRPHRLALGLLLVALVMTSAHPALSGAASAAGQDGHPAAACSAPYHVQGAGWDLCWQQEDLRVQGLELNRVFFHNESVAWKMGVPFSLTIYDQPTGKGPFKDVLGAPGEAEVPGFGRGSLQIDPAACPRFHEHGELFNDGRVCVEHRDGVAPAIAIWARYDAFNYRFLQGWHLDDRGTVEPFVTMGGHLVDGAWIGDGGMNHYHHVYWRLDLDIAGPGQDRFELFKRVGGEKPIVDTVDHRALDEAKPVEDAVDRGGCRPVGSGSRANISATFWCTVRAETELTYDQRTHDKWRVADPNSTNAMGRAKSFEFTVKSDGPANRFSSFDAMVLEHKGDSQELGYEVPTAPFYGDQALDWYHLPPEVVTDPVVWVVHHTYHDTRDEDRGSMSYHHVDFPLRPHNFVDENPGEASFP